MTVGETHERTVVKARELENKTVIEEDSDGTREKTVIKKDRD